MSKLSEYLKEHEHRYNWRGEEGPVYDLRRKYSDKWDKLSKKVGGLAFVFYALSGILGMCKLKMASIAFLAGALPPFILFMFYTMRMLRGYIPPKERALIALERLDEDG
jgi:hypothetical protein